jgi:hypothetical protein
VRQSLQTCAAAPHSSSSATDARCPSANSRLAQASNFKTRAAKQGTLDFAQLHAGWADKHARTLGVSLASVAPSVWHGGTEQTYVTLQVIPYSAGAHIGLQGGFAIADLPDSPGIVFLDSVADGQTVEDAAIVSQVTQVTQRFDALRAEALPRSASRDMIRKVAEERWT